MHEIQPRNHLFPQERTAQPVHQPSGKRGQTLAPVSRNSFRRTRRRHSQTFRRDPQSFSRRRDAYQPQRNTRASQRRRNPGHAAPQTRTSPRASRKRKTGLFRLRQQRRRQPRKIQYSQIRRCRPSQSKPSGRSIRRRSQPFALLQAGIRALCFVRYRHRKKGERRSAQAGSPKQYSFHNQRQIYRRSQP